MTSGASNVNSEHILQFILLLSLLNKQMPFGPEKFQTINLFQVTVGNTFS